MSRVCDVTGTRTRVGNRVARRGLAKKQGGVGRRVTGRSKRKFKANIQKVRVLDPDGRILHLRLSTRAIKTGIIEVERDGKTVRFPLVRALRGRHAAAMEDPVIAEKVAQKAAEREAAKKTKAKKKA